MAPPPEKLSIDNRYDAVPYRSEVFPMTCPDGLAVTSWLFGGPVPRGEGIRLLEIGCAAGGNLIPLAYYQRDSSFVGVDYSAVQIKEAQQTADALGLTNLELLHRDLMDLDPQELGAFDYIIVHGVFSWVPDPVRMRILEICRDQLAPEGLAYISFNTLPGWYIRGIIREFLINATAGVEDLQQRALAAQRAAGVMRGLLQHSTAPEYAELLARDLDRIVAWPSSYILHEFLSEENRPFYLSEFIRLLESRGLAYVADADRNRPAVEWSEPADEALTAAGFSGAGMEQFWDVLTSRCFRCAIVCRADAPRARRPGPGILGELTIASSLVPEATDVELQPEVAEIFRANQPYLGVVESSTPLVKAALTVLANHYPRGLSTAALLRESVRLLRAHGGVGEPGEEALAELRQRIFHLFAYGMVVLRRREPSVVGPPGDAFHALATYEAQTRRALTTPFHTVATMDDLCLRTAHGKEEVTLVGEAVEVFMGEEPSEVLRGEKREVLERTRLALHNAGLLAPRRDP